MISGLNYMVKGNDGIQREDLCDLKNNIGLILFSMKKNNEQVNLLSKK